MDRTNEIWLDDTVATDTDEGKETIKLWIQQGVRTNGGVYSDKFEDPNAGEQVDVLQFCLYAATTDDGFATGTQVGFAEVKVKLTYTATGVISDFDEPVTTDKNSIADANANNNVFNDVFDGLEAFLCELKDDGKVSHKNTATTITPGQTVGVCIGFKESHDEKEFRMNVIKSCSYNKAAGTAGAVTQDAIDEDVYGEDGAAALTSYTYKSYDSTDECKRAEDGGEDTECHELYFESDLNVDFFLGGPTLLKLNCIVQVIPILKGSRIRMLHVALPASRVMICTRWSWI